MSQPQHGTRFIADGAVTNAKLAADAVTQAKIANDAVGTAEIIDGNVTLAKIAAAARAAAATASVLVERDANGRAQFASPSAAGDAATKAYVDAVAAGVRDFKEGVRVATTVALPSYSNGGAGVPTWTTNAGVDETNGGATLTSNYYAGGNWSVFVRSTNTVVSANGGQVSATSWNNSASGDRVLGLIGTGETFTGTGPTPFADVDAMVLIGPTGNWQAYDNGTPGTTGTVSGSDVLAVVIESGVLKLKKNGSTVHTYSASPLDATYNALVAFNDNTAQLNGLLIGGVPSNVITATANGALPQIDGVTLAGGDRLLLKNGAAGADNGIYTVTQLGDGSNPFILTRAADADTSAEVTAGMYLFVTEGSTYADTAWVLSTNDPITLNTTALTFTQFASLADLQAGTALTKTGTTIDHDASGVTPGTYEMAKVVVDAQGHATSVTARQFQKFSGTATGGENTLATGTNVLADSTRVKVDGIELSEEHGDFSIVLATGAITLTTALVAGEKWEAQVVRDA